MGLKGRRALPRKAFCFSPAIPELPLLPVSMAADPCWRFRSWDRTVLAKPFSKIVMAIWAAHMD